MASVWRTARSTGFVVGLTIAVVAAAGAMLTIVHSNSAAKQQQLVVSNYDTIFALGGKSLITILYTEGPAVPPGCAVFQMSADVRDLGRT